MKNKAKLKEMGIDGKEKYYYIRFGKGADNVPDGFLGVATVCLLPYGSRITSFDESQDKSYTRGTSFCNPLDQFTEKKGRSIALWRAIKAWERGYTSEPLPRATPALILRNHDICFLSEFNPVLTDYEKRIMGSEKECHTLLSN